MTVTDSDARKGFSAGIIGLSCADTLLRHGACVTLIAEWLPGDDVDMMVPAEFASAWYVVSGLTALLRGLLGQA